MTICALIAAGVVSTWSAHGTDRGPSADLRCEGSGFIHPYAAVLVSPGRPSFASAGLEMRFGHRLYLQPGLGVGIHNGPLSDFGSRVLFNLSASVGYQLTPRAAVEAGVQHWSNAYIVHPNHAMNAVGVRFVIKS